MEHLELFMLAVEDSHLGEGLDFASHLDLHHAAFVLHFKHEADYFSVVDIDNIVGLEKPQDCFVIAVESLLVGNPEGVDTVEVDYRSASDVENSGIVADVVDSELPASGFEHEPNLFLGSEALCLFEL